MDIDVLMSVGKKIDISSLAIPENFTVKHFYEIPQLEVLNECECIYNSRWNEQRP
jgi:hypothetical protein